MFWLPMLAGAAVGALQQGQKAKQADKQRAMAGEVEKYSPWTGMHGSSMMPTDQGGDYLGGAMSGGLSGAAFGQGLEKPKVTPDAAGGLAPANPAASPSPVFGTPAFGPSPWEAQMRQKQGWNPGQ